MAKYREPGIERYSKRALKLHRRIMPINMANRELKRYTIEETRQILKDNPGGHYLEPDLLGDRKIKTRRASVYFKKGFGCVVEDCDVEGLFFVLNLDPGDGIHLDLHGMDEGKEILMTIDHIHPKSKGGKNSIENYQPMCLVCNNLKSDNIE